MTVTEQRRRYRQVLQGSECIHPASVFDPISARIAQDLGFEVGMFAGSVASLTVLGAPDVVVLTLTEFAGQIRRISRAADLPLMVDADHGYGNALNVMRTVQELEAAGVSAMTIEDTVLPLPYGDTSGEAMISVEEMMGKLRAALEARSDPSLCIIGRTSALRSAGMEETLRRVKAYSQLDIDGMFLVGVNEPGEMKAVREVTSLPLLIGASPPSLGTTQDLGTLGVRIALQGHLPFQAAVQAVYHTLNHLREGHPPQELRERVASSTLMAQVTRRVDYDRWVKDFLT